MIIIQTINKTINQPAISGPNTFFDTLIYFHTPIIKNTNQSGIINANAMIPPLGPKNKIAHNMEIINDPAIANIAIENAPTKENIYLFFNNFIPKLLISVFSGTKPDWSTGF